MHNYNLRGLTPKEMDREEEEYLQERNSKDESFIDAGLNSDEAVFRTFLRGNIMDNEPL
jgi:hypothetical protein